MFNTPNREIEKLKKDCNKFREDRDKFEKDIIVLDERYDAGSEILGMKEDEIKELEEEIKKMNNPLNPLPKTDIRWKTLQERKNEIKDVTQKIIVILKSRMDIDRKLLDTVEELEKTQKKIKKKSLKIDK